MHGSVSKQKFSTHAKQTCDDERTNTALSERDSAITLMTSTGRKRKNPGARRSSEAVTSYWCLGKLYQEV